MKNKLTTPQTQFLVSVFLISSATLAFEVLTIRFVSILFFPIATYVVISLALFGFGLSGGYLTLKRFKKGLSKDLAAVGSAGFAIAMLISLLSIWYAAESSIFVALLPLTLSLPFLFGGFAIGVCLSLPAAHINQVYFSDLAGAGVGAILVMLLLHILSGVQILLLLVGIGLLSAALFFENFRKRNISLFASILFLVGGVFAPIPYGIIPISPKELSSMVEQYPNAEWEYQGWNPLARIDVITLPGDRLQLPGNLAYKLVTQDGGAPSILLSAEDNNALREFFDSTIFGLPYEIFDDPSVLIIGLGGGPDVQAALLKGARKITGVEVNRRMISLVTDEFAQFVGSPYDDERVQIHEEDGRNFLLHTSEKFDIIQLTGVDTSVASIGASPNMAENYLYTVEAFSDYYLHLTEDGLLSVSFPNVEGLGLRLVALATGTLSNAGVENPQEHIFVSQISGYVHVLVKKAPFSTDEIATLVTRFERPISSLYFPLYHRLFGSPEKSFIKDTLIIFPSQDQNNIYQEYFTAFHSGEGDAFLISQPETVTPPTDNTPFFFVLDKLGARSVNLQALMIALAMLSVAALLLILVPLIFQNLRGINLSGSFWLSFYFLCLGLGYILFEVYLIQKFVLILGHPSYTISVTLGTLLISSGLGSLVSGRFKISNERKIFLASFVVAASIFALTILMDNLNQLPQMSLPSRIILSAIFITIPGFFMGMPFPTGLAEVKKDAPSFIGWAWAINSSASVIATILGLILAILFGLRIVAYLAIAVYLLSALSFLGYKRHMS